MDLLREKHTPQTECGPSQKTRGSWILLIERMIPSCAGTVLRALHALFYLIPIKK